jgi:hypothetical protein
VFQSDGLQFKYNESEYESLFDTVAEVADLMQLIAPATHALKQEYSLKCREGTEPHTVVLVFGDHADEFARKEFSVRWTYITLVNKMFWNAVWAERELKPQAYIDCPNVNNTKEENYLYLPERYREFTMSCRKGSNCGNCDPCLDLEAIRARNDTDDTE